MDNSFKLNDGLRMGRKLLLEINELYPNAKIKILTEDVKIEIEKAVSEEKEVSVDDTVSFGKLTAKLEKRESQA